MKLIILDRDGVINYDSDNYIKSVDEFIPLPGSLEAIAALNKANYRVAIATNQSGIARGYYDQQELEAMHHKLDQELSKVGGHIDYIAFCPHGPDDHCNCRKPLAGMLEEISNHFKVGLSDVPVIGDSLRDLQSAQTVGARPILVKTGKGERTIAKGEGMKGVPVYTDLAAAV
ncbi:MAG: D-glycero-beta-D-manno-heptose 1,7-bisphosphate 7-phosphatase, partial [Gammaproteobacteria bacterium]|nr:D-glycero-beta-D-manno-heptose 1,7-bisphosphate 7-phosphatase [Gammaproteobacteria bacterium]